MTIDKETLHKEAGTALHALHRLFLEPNRSVGAIKAAEQHVRIIEQALYAGYEMVGHLNQIGVKLHWAGKEIEHRKDEVAKIKAEVES